MGESTLYNYFQNKRDILLAIIDFKRLELDEFLGQIDQVTQQNTAHAEESASAAE